MNAQVWLVPLLWLAWISPFILFRPKEKGTIVKKAPAARWGILLQTFGYWVLYIPSGDAWVRQVDLWRVIAGVVLGVAAIALATAGIRHLGKQWRVNAALNADHELVRTGPYRIVRHPIYASMLAMMLMSILLLGRMPLWPIALLLFVAGLEIRVRTEDQLLRGRFGEQFEQWKNAVPAYLPPIR